MKSYKSIEQQSRLQVLLAATQYMHVEWLGNSSERKLPYFS